MHINRTKISGGATEEDSTQRKQKATRRQYLMKTTQNGAHRAIFKYFKTHNS
jgi:hypothetical protein